MIILLFPFFLLSCNSIYLNKSGVKRIDQEPVIGAIGLLKDKLLTNSFEEQGFPLIATRIGLSVEKKYFNSQTLALFNKKVKDSTKRLKIVDSINYKPTFYSVSIIDKVALTAALNSHDNEGLLNYLKISENNVIVTKGWIYFSPEIEKLLDQSKGVFLAMSSGIPELEIIDSNGKQRRINFNLGTSFAYEFSDFCWKENYRHTPVIGVIKNLHEPCPGNSKKNPDKVDRKNLFDKI